VVATVNIADGHKLSSKIKEENLVFAVTKIASFLGISSVNIVISNRVIQYKNRDTRARWPTKVLLGEWEEDNDRITLYDKGMVLRARRNKTSLLRVYSTVVPHELVHASQTYRGGMDSLCGTSMKDLVEGEAEALESVFGPVAYECLKAGR